MSFRTSPLTRRTFIGRLASLTPALASAARRDGLQPSDALVVSPLDDWGYVETASGRFLVGELIIRNRSRVPRVLIGLQLQEIGRLEGANLLSRMANPADNSPLQSRTLAAGDSALLYLWERIPGTATTIRSAVVVAGGGDLAADPEAVALSPGSPLVPPIIVSPPLSGGPWVALYDPQMPRGHRRVAFARDGKQVVPARFAIDFVRLNDAGRPAADAPDDFGRWLGLGADVLAVADAEVVAARDSFPDVLTRERPAQWTDEDVSGNHVGLAVAPGRVAFYEHLQRGSVRVKVGERVRAGQPIARLGRSGVNSSGPHLHFHVGTDPSTLDSQGRPWALSRFEVVGGYPDIMTALAGKPWTSASGPAQSRIVRNVLPEPNCVVKFSG